MIIFLHVQQDMRVTRRRLYSSTVNTSTVRTVSYSLLLENTYSHHIVIYRLGHPIARTMLPSPRLSLLEHS